MDANVIYVKLFDDFARQKLSKSTNVSQSYSEKVAQFLRDTT